MGREVRMVPANWVHPTHTAYGTERYIPMLDQSFSDALKEWEETEVPEWLAGEKLWHEEGIVIYDDERLTLSALHEKFPEHGDFYDDWAGEFPLRPSRKNYMPQWPESEKTHFMMYETTSEGTPISPAFATAHELASWLVENKASIFSGNLATYDEWMTIINGAFITTEIAPGIFTMS